VLFFCAVMAGWPQEKPTPFVMDEWKRTYSNCGGDYKKAMEVSDLPRTVTP